MSSVPSDVTLSINDAAPIQNWDALKQQYSPPALLNKVLQSFISHHHQSSHELRSLLAARDFVALGKVAHKLKGAACIMHAPLIIQCAEQIEQDIQDTGVTPAEHSERLAQLMDQWITEISGKLANLA